jgi:hypothetical protein
MSDLRDSAGAETFTSEVPRDRDGLWVQTREDAYWFFVREDHGRRRLVVFDRMAP